jgi:hypothetical protein
MIGAPADEKELIRLVRTFLHKLETHNLSPFSGQVETVPGTQISGLERLHLLIAKTGALSFSSYRACGKNHFPEGYGLQCLHENSAVG